MTSLSNSPIWVSPGNYPSRCSNDRAEAIALRILAGQTPNVAAAAEGVMPPRFRQWLRWGRDAYKRDANAEDSQAPYLNLYLKVGQAVALATAAIHERVYQDNPHWWLTHHPDVRGDWLPEQALPGALIAAPDDFVESISAEEQAATSTLRVTGNELRDALRVLVESGAAVAPVASDEPLTSNETTTDASLGDSSDGMIVDADPTSQREAG